MSAPIEGVRTPFHDYVELSPDDLNREIARLEDKLQFARYALAKQRENGLFRERYRQWERIRAIAIGSSLIAATGMPFALDEESGTYVADVVVGTVPKGETVPFASDTKRAVRGTPRAMLHVWARPVTEDGPRRATLAIEPSLVGGQLPVHILNAVVGVYRLLAIDLLKSMGVDAT